MANIHIEIRAVKRSAGQRATAAAAYRAGERIRDERTRKLYNHSRRQDVTHKEIFLPSSVGEAPLEWARDRASLWNAAESAEKRSNSRVAREFQVSLPSELSATQRLALARGFAREMADRYGVAVDLAIHDPKPGGDPRNFHAHLLATTREVTAWGLGDKAGLDMHALQRAKQGLSDHSEEYTAVRERWAAHMNDAFREANIDERVDHRTLAAQGIDREPMVYVPAEFYRREIKGLKPGQLGRLREEYRARVLARRAIAKQLTAAKEPVALEPKALELKAAEPKAQEPRVLEPRVLEPRVLESKAPESKVPEPAAPPTRAIDPRNVEEIRKNAVQAWLRMRAKEVENGLAKEAASEESQPPGSEPARDLNGGSHAEDVPDASYDNSSGRSQEHSRDSHHAAERGRAQSHDHVRSHDRCHDRSNDRSNDHDTDSASAPAHDGYDDDFGM